MGELCLSFSVGACHTTEVGQQYFVFLLIFIDIVAKLGQAVKIIHLVLEASLQQSST